MTRKELSQVYFLKKELKMWEQKLEDLRSKSLISAKAPNGMPFANTGDISDKTFDYISEIMELQSDIDVFRLRIEVVIKGIEDYIMTLDDSLLRQIIEYRCCQCKTWSQTAAMIGAGTTEDSIKKYFNRRYPKSKDVPNVPNVSDKMVSSDID